MHELIRPNKKDIEKDYKAQFQGMVEDEVSLNDLYEARDSLIESINKSWEDSEKEFLIKIAEGQCDDNHLEYHGIGDLPAIRFKIINIEKLKKTNPDKYREQISKLASVLGQI